MIYNWDGAGDDNDDDHHDLDSEYDNFWYVHIQFSEEWKCESWYHLHVSKCAAHVG